MSDDVTLLIVPSGRGQSKHALIIEDDRLVAAAIEAELREVGYASFQHARSSKEAVAGAMQLRPDLITADSQLPSGNALQAVEEICGIQAVPVIIITRNPLAVTLPQVPTLGKPF
ncbi:MAG: hypothetical protein AVDCRST_MAG93-1124, partial [uncultured Chloroflexia bacterium]